MTVAQIPHSTELDNLPIDYTAVLRHLGLNGNDPKAQAVVLVCKRYDLDPILKHVVLVENSVYITRDGLLHVAHSTGQLDGIEVEEATLSEDGKEWRSRASVYRKDMARPFAFSGRFAAGRKNSPEMAEKVAVARALKHAFAVAIATDDERQAQDSRPVASSAPPVTAAEILAKPAPHPDEPARPVEDREHVADEPPLITTPQSKKLHALLNENGMTDRTLALAYISDTLGRDVDSSKVLTKVEAGEVIDALERIDRTPDPAEWPPTAQPGGAE